MKGVRHRGLNDVKDRKISIFTSCLRRLTTQKRGNNDMKIQSQTVCDCLRSIGDDFCAHDTF